MTVSHKPPWIRNHLPSAPAVARVAARSHLRGLETVCRAARCPNQGECFERGTATFLILGNRCTRTCTFCAVPKGEGLPLNPREPELVAAAVAALGLGHAVITSVTRDDLADGGAVMFVEALKAVRSQAPRTSVELLVPDFQGSERALARILDAGPEVLNHNLETVSRLYPRVRPEASYERSLTLLARVRRSNAAIKVKSGIMLGLGEKPDEIRALIQDLADVGCSALTMGQYLQPTPRHVPVHRFLRPAEFDELRNTALTAGIGHVVAGPMVRSSYRAEELMDSPTP